MFKRMVRYLLLAIGLIVVEGITISLIGLLSDTLIHFFGLDLATISTGSWRGSSMRGSLGGTIFFIAVFGAGILYFRATGVFQKVPFSQVLSNLSDGDIRGNPDPWIVIAIAVMLAIVLELAFTLG